MTVRMSSEGLHQTKTVWTRDKNIKKCNFLGMAQQSTKKLRNKRMAYTHHNDAMTIVHLMFM